MTFRRGAASSSSAVRLRTPRMLSRSNRSDLFTVRPTRVPEERVSNSHRHDHGDVVLPRVRRCRANHRGVELAAETGFDLLVGDGAQHVEEVARVEADRQLGSRVVARELVEALAALRAFAFEPQL